MSMVPQVFFRLKKKTPVGKNVLINKNMSPHIARHAGGTDKMA